MNLGDIHFSNLAIVGFGFVGQAQYYKLLDNCRNRVVIYDKYKTAYKDNFEKIRNFKSNDSIIMLCLPTNMNDDGSQDFSAFEDFFELLPNDYKGLIVIKSTILFNNIAPYLDKYKIVYCPEFLNQNTAYEDIISEERIVLGGSVDDCYNVNKFYKSCFVNSDKVQYKYCSIQEAIHLKYIHNINHAYKVLFWNYVHEITGNQRKVFDLYSFIRNRDMSNEMSRIYSDGKGGYGGACFTKDVNAYNDLYHHELTEFMKKYNERIRWDNKQIKD